jgi:hypothetical protein
VEDAEAALADSLDDDSIDWSDDAVGDEEDDGSFDPDAMKDVLREEGLDALFDTEAEAVPTAEMPEEEGSDGLFGAEGTTSADDHGRE